MNRHWYHLIIVGFIFFLTMFIIKIVDAQVVPGSPIIKVFHIKDHPCFDVRISGRMGYTTTMIDVKNIYVNCGSYFYNISAKLSIYLPDVATNPPIAAWQIAITGTPAEVVGTITSNQLKLVRIEVSPDKQLVDSTIFDDAGKAHKIETDFSLSGL